MGEGQRAPEKIGLSGKGDQNTPRVQIQKEGTPGHP